MSIFQQQTLPSGRWREGFQAHSCISHSAALSPQCGHSLPLTAVWREDWGLLVSWFLNTSTMQVYPGDGSAQTTVRAETRRSCRSNLLFRAVTIHWHQANQPKHWPCNARHLAGQLLEYQVSKSQLRLDRGNRGSICVSVTLKVDALLRAQRQLRKEAGMSDA